MTIKAIFDEISAESSTNQKIKILEKYKDNDLLKHVLYLANSKRVKFYIKQIPLYSPTNQVSLEKVLKGLDVLSERKVTGQDAIDHLQEMLSDLSADDAYILERIIEKDCKIGMGTTQMNKVFKNLIEDTPYMGAISFDEKKAKGLFGKGKVVYSQIKMDGRYCNAIIRGGEVELESRSGEPTVVTGAKFLKELERFEDCVLNGELTMANTTRYESNGIIASIIDIQSKRSERTEVETNKKIAEFEKKNGNFQEALDSIRFTIWDTITVDEYFDKKSKTKYNIRLIKVGELIGNAKAKMVSMIKTKICNTYAEAMSHFQEALSNGEEGTIIKAYDGEWKDGKPSHQIKMKLEMDVDLKIVSFNYGAKGTKNENLISSLNCESSDGLVKTRPQGIKEDMMTYITENQNKLMNTVIKAKCNGLSKDSDGNYSLLHPAFIELRDDKDTCDSLDDIIKIETMIKELNK